jgi:hypothetical protein
MTLMIAILIDISIDKHSLVTPSAVAGTNSVTGHKRAESVVARILE